MLDKMPYIIDNLHFIKPIWFWAFLPLSLIVILVLIANREDNKWKKLIAPHLRDHLFIKGSKQAFWLPIIAFILSCSAITLALSGPTWKMKDLPGGKASAVLLIGLDLSHSMLANDISPNRLERIKLKISDLLDADPETDIGLFAYAGTPHIVVPFCSDYSIVKHHTESLHPALMPLKGSNMSLAIQLADSLLSRIEAPSTLLLITDHLNESDAQLINSFVEKGKHKVTIIPSATTSGGVMPSFYNKNRTLKNKNGSNRMATCDMEVFDRLDRHEKINTIPLTLDQSDVEHIAEQVRKEKMFTLNDEVDDEEWDNKGWLLIFPALILVLSWFRKGWSIFWMWSGLLLMTSCSPNDKHASWWYSDNYRAQHQYKEGNYEKAAATFESIPHKGMAYFKAGNYEAALEVFSYDSTAIGLFNKGVTLTQLGRLEEASDAFEKVISLQPDMTEALKNLERTQRMISERDSISSKMGNVVKLDKNKKKEEPLKEYTAKTKDEELSSDTETDELPKDGKRVTDEVATDITKAEELERPDEAQDQEMTQKAAQNIMLKKISSDPGEFLKRRFKFQRDKHYKDVKATGDI